MLSALIGTEHSYPALPLAGQPADQRFVHLGPLVLETTPLKYQRPHQIWTNLSHALCYAEAHLMSVGECSFLGEPYITVGVGLYLHLQCRWLTFSLYGCL